MHEEVHAVTRRPAAARRAEVLPYIERLRNRFAIPIVYVSHAVEEVERLADEIVTMEAGRVMGVKRLERP